MSFILIVLPSIQFVTHTSSTFGRYKQYPQSMKSIGTNEGSGITFSHNRFTLQIVLNYLSFGPNINFYKINSFSRTVV